MLYEEQTSVLRRCFYHVHNEVGLGRGEEAYHVSAGLWLKKNGIPFESKTPHPIMLGNDLAHVLYPDLVIWDMITVDLKVLLWGFQRGSYVQLFNYLKRRRDELGLLVNMGLDRVGIDRRIYSVPEYKLIEDWNAWMKRIPGRSREIGRLARRALDEIYRTHQTGYSDDVTRDLILCALRRQGLAFTQNPIGKAFYEGNCVHESAFECIVVEGEVLLVFTALFDSNDFNVKRGRSFLEGLGMRWGIAANFGKTTAQFTGIANPS